MLFGMTEAVKRMPWLTLRSVSARGPRLDALEIHQGHAGEALHGQHPLGPGISVARLWHG